MTTIKNILAILMLMTVIPSSAQRFFNLTAEEVEIDSIMPSVSCVMPLPDNYTDSLYTASILYPEFIDMTESDIAKYKALAGDNELGALPVVNSFITENQKKYSMVFHLEPIVKREGKYQFLVSFMLKVEAKPNTKRGAMQKAPLSEGRYAMESVLNTGKWAKISVPSTGIFRLTNDVIRRAGFSDINKVHIYGYGGNRQPEVLSPQYLIDTDDLKEIKTLASENGKYFYGKGPVSWTVTSTTGAYSARTRNPYSNYGYYFITEDDATEPLVYANEEELIEEVKASPDIHYNLYEKDEYAWLHGGRNLYEADKYGVGGVIERTITSPSEGRSGMVCICLSAGSTTTFDVDFNGSRLTSSTVTIRDYDKGNTKTLAYRVTDLKRENNVKITIKSGGMASLDYIWIYTDDYKEPVVDASAPAASYVYNITNQNLHSHDMVDMTIIIPTSQKLLKQAERLAEHHRTHDGMTVRIVPADEIYNEFSSGTPDATAYKRYMKMLYDRASLEEMEKPHYLLLFGDGLWDNRLLTSSCRQYNADDLLLCYESENSFNEVNCFVCDDFFTILGDNESLGTETRCESATTTNNTFTASCDIAVGRIPVTTENEAKIVVDKVITYASNKNAGKWKNTLVFMGDDGNNNMHQTAINNLVDSLSNTFPGYNMKKIIWEAFERTTSSTGNTYPGITNIVHQYNNDGVLVMDYAGHGNPSQISHETVLTLSDFQNFRNSNLPLWITASCDIMPYDGTESTIGEQALLNPNGGAIAFYGTTRTVYAAYNAYINETFLRHMLTPLSEGKNMTFGEAQRRAKNELVTRSRLYDRTVNKLQYTLLGDPAVALARPVEECVVDSFVVEGNNRLVYNNTEMAQIEAGATVHIHGHIANRATKEKYDDFFGTVNAWVHDNLETVTCFLNEPDTKVPFTYKDYTKTLFNGSDSVRAGRFDLVFVVPRDINYSSLPGMLKLYAVNSDKTIEANGEYTNYRAGGSVVKENDGTGPSIYCYLNSPSFINGGDVNTTPYFYAEVKDKDGINASGTGIGHDLQLRVDDDKLMTYTLNDNFTFDFGSYTTGSTYYVLPALAPGMHKLTFRAWDILNNPSTTELTFNVVQALEPTFFDVNVTTNPARDSTTFVISHDRIGSAINANVEIFDMSGRLLHKLIYNGVTQDSSSYAIPWDLTTATGSQLQTGVYLYRANISCDGSSEASKAKKLIVIRQ